MSEQGFKIDYGLFNSFLSYLSTGISTLEKANTASGDVLAFPDGFEYSSEVSGAVEVVSRELTRLQELNSSAEDTKSAMANQTVPGYEELLITNPELYYASIYGQGTTTAETWKETGATIFVGAESFCSGLLRTGESITDGATWFAGHAWAGLQKLFGNDSGAERTLAATYDYIGIDQTGNARRAFYDNTELGRSINAYSAIKYDSEAANRIMDIGESVGNTAVLTGASILTGGTGGAIMGGLMSAGKSSQTYAQTVDREHGEQYDYLKGGLYTGTRAAFGAATGYLAGSAVSAASTASSSTSTATNAMNVLKNASQNGLKETAKQLGSNAAKTTAEDLASSVSEDFIDYAFGVEEIDPNKIMADMGKTVIENAISPD